MSSPDQLDHIRGRGTLRVAVSQGIPGLSEPVGDNYRGLDADFARAVAAAVLSDPEAITWLPVSPADRIPAVRENRADLGACNLSWTLSRAAQVLFVGVLCHDGEGLLVRSDTNAAGELEGRAVAVQAGTTTAENLLRWRERGGPTVTPIEGSTPQAALEHYTSGRCEAYVLDRTALAGIRSRLPNPEAHRLLPDVISAEPMAPFVSPDHLTLWRAAQAVYAVLVALDGPESASRVCGTANALAPLFGLTEGWASRAADAVGSHEAMFERHLGAASELRLDLGPNRAIASGGVLFAPAMA